jgi:hypothetical protein
MKKIFNRIQTAGKAFPGFPILSCGRLAAVIGCPPGQLTLKASSKSQQPRRDERTPPELAVRSAVKAEGDTNAARNPSVAP